MAKIEWTKPAGKTQADLDAELAADQVAEDRRRALELLEGTDYQVIKAIESFLDGQGLLDRALVDSRKAARESL